MSLSTMKMPDPIMEPTTMAVELNRPRLWTSPVGRAVLLAVGVDLDGRVVISGVVTANDSYLILVQLSLALGSDVSLEPLVYQGRESDINIFRYQPSRSFHLRNSAAGSGVLKMAAATATASAPASITRHAVSSVMP